MVGDDLAESIWLEVESDMPGHEGMYVANPDNIGDRDLYAAKLAHLNGRPPVVHDRLFFNRPSR